MSNLDLNLILRQYKIDSRGLFMEIKNVKPKLKQHQVARKLGYSISTLKRY